MVGQVQNNIGFRRARITAVERDMYNLNSGLTCRWMSYVTDFKLDIDVSVKAENDWRDVGDLKLQCIAIVTFSSDIRN